MIEIDPTISYECNIDYFLSHYWNKHDSSFSKPMIKYFLGNYDDFLSIRTKELSLNKNSFLFKFKMILSNPIMFKKNEDQWNDIKKIIKQTYYFTNKKDKQFYIPFEHESGAFSHALAVS